MSDSDDRAKRFRRLRWITAGGIAVALGSTGTCLGAPSVGLNWFDYMIPLACLTIVGLGVALTASVLLVVARLK